MGLDELFVTCLNDSDKIAKPIKNYLDFFINTSLNHMSIRSRLVSQPNNKLIFFTFGVILPPKFQQILKLFRQIRMRIKILKYVLSIFY